MNLCPLIFFSQLEIRPDETSEIVIYLRDYQSLLQNTD